MANFIIVDNKDNSTDRFTLVDNVSGFQLTCYSNKVFMLLNDMLEGRYITCFRKCYKAGDCTAIKFKNSSECISNYLPRKDLDSLIRFIVKEIVVGKNNFKITNIFLRHTDLEKLKTIRDIISKYGGAYDKGIV